LEAEYGHVALARNFRRRRIFHRRRFAPFANALQNHKLLDARHTELLTTGKWTRHGGKYAYGFIDLTSAESAVSATAAALPV